MNATTIAADLAKNVFQLAVADSHWKVIETHRLTRGQCSTHFYRRWILEEPKHEFGLRPSEKSIEFGDH